EGSKRNISVQSILLPRHSFVKEISVVFGIGDGKQYKKISIFVVPVLALRLGFQFWLILDCQS
ncbi:hypothetical protein Avbf_17304, partial [Armadillidium vulgare]